jgi:hypothetical protein
MRHRWPTPIDHIHWAATGTNHADDVDALVNAINHATTEKILLLLLAVTEQTMNVDQLGVRCTAIRKPAVSAMAISHHTRSCVTDNSGSRRVINNQVQQKWNSGGHQR